METKKIPILYLILALAVVSLIYTSTVLASSPKEMGLQKLYEEEVLARNTCERTTTDVEARRSPPLGGG